MPYSDSLCISDTITSEILSWSAKRSAALSTSSCLLMGTPRAHALRFASASASPSSLGLCLAFWSIWYEPSSSSVAWNFSFLP